MKNKSLLLIHCAVLLFGFSGLFVKMIPMPAMILTLGRALFSSIALYIYCMYRHQSVHLERARDYFWNVLAGVFLTIHWFFFILSIQVSKVSIGTITFATYPLFVVFMEPFAFKEKFQLKNLIMVILLSTGIGFLIPSFQLDNQNTLGIIYGFISSFSFAVLSVINRRLASTYEGVVITFYEQIVAAVVMTLLITFVTPKFTPGTTLQFLEFIVYGVIFTALAHSLYIQGLRDVKAQTASFISGLEPVYSILFAYLILNEGMTYQEILGSSIILITVLLSPLESLIQRTEKNEKIS